MMQTPTHTTTPMLRDRRPRLAFVLGSGGVRSIAAVGSAEVLAREGVRPDLVVGCSSGPLFGTTIAMGMTPDQALRTATKMWSQELTRQHRWRGWLQPLAPKLSTAMINDLTKARNAAARVAGQRVLHIELALERRVGLRETAALPYLYEAGRRAARAQLPQIMALLEGRPSPAAA
jgi:hypothetical protein